MNLLDYISAGGVGSGCHGEDCGRPKVGIKPPIGIIPAGKSTEDVFRNSKSKEWEPQREAWHQGLADAMIKGKQPQSNPPNLYILGGGTGSGKSVVSRQIESGNKNIVHIDADGIKPLIPEYEQLKKNNEATAATRVHEESSYIAKLTMAKAAASKLDLIYDASSSGKGLSIMINQMKQEGYNVHMMFVDVPEALAKQRAEARAANPNNQSGFGRHIPEALMHNTHVLSSVNFMVMKDSPMVSSAKLYDNTIKPRLVYSKEGSSEGVVHDSKTWEYYQKKATGR